MKMSLFSVFNPITSEKYSIMWMTAITLILFIPIKMWKMETKTMKFTMMITNYVLKQLKNMLKSPIKMNSIFMMTTMMTILIMNMMGMLPFMYAQTSQPQITMSMAIPLWLAMMMMKMKQPNKLMAHMVPISTPTILMPFMVLIESISTIIQPITLSIRLMANITAGHILMMLISSSYSNKSMDIITMIIQMMFTMMEIFVSFIQAYVFSMLLTMYTK